MKDYVIISDSGCGLVREEREQYGIEYVKMYYCYDGKNVPATNDWEELSAKEFYDLMRGGKKITTAQVTMQSYMDVFEKAITDGKDVLYIGTPVVLSNGLSASLIVKDKLIDKYPDSKIICIDAYTCCFGLGMICIKASEMRAEGKDIEQTAKWIEENRTRFHQEGTVDKLDYLKRAGRVSSTSAFFGGLLNIKPIIICDVKGRNVAVEKVKGRKASLARIVERFKGNYVSGVCKQIYISHADCLEDAIELKRMVEDVIKGEDTEIKIGYVVSPIGATVGPGMIGLYFYGKEITYDAESK